MKAKSNQQWTIRSNNQNSEGNRTGKHLVQTFGFFRSFNPKLLKRWCGKQKFGFPVHTSCPSINTSNKSHSKTTRVKAVVIAIALTTAILLVLLTLHMMRKRKHQMAKAWKLTAFQRLDFKAEEVVECLKEETIIGKGGAGIVYRGSMPNEIVRR